MVLAAVPSSKHFCIFCQGPLVVDIHHSGSFRILCGDCEREMIDCMCFERREGHLREHLG